MTRSAKRRPQHLEGIVRAVRDPTRNSRKAAVVVSADERARKTKRVGTLADFFASSPLGGSGLKVKRSRDKLRSSDL